MDVGGAREGTTAHGAEAEPVGQDGPAADPVRRWRRPILAGGVVLLVAPLLVALVVLHDPRWFPALELAQTELHVRDVGGSDTQLTGLIGRLGAPGEQGSHLGPSSFLALAPVYRLAGSTPWALQVSTVVLHLAAVGVALWLAHRRGGFRLLVLVGVVLTVLLRFYGAHLLTEPWNPYLPMLWWVVFVLAVWSVAMRDIALLPVVVVAGTFCVQTHISYLGLISGLTAYAVASVLVQALALRRRQEPATRIWSVLAVSAAIGAVLWFPPVLEELRRQPGNLRVVFDTFADSSEDPIGPVEAVRLLLAYLDPWRLLARHAEAKVVTEAPTWPVAGMAFLTAWAGSAFVVWRLRHRALLHLDAVLGIALVLGAIGTSRIFGVTWAWLVQWVWGLTALMVVAIVWTVGAVLERRARVDARARLARVGAVVMAVVALGSAVGLAVDASGVEPDDTASSRALSHLVPETLDALERERPHRGPYLIDNVDPVGVVGELQTFGLLNELDRAGVPVGIEPRKRLRAAPRLTLRPQQAGAVLRVVTGSAIDEWERNPAARRLATFEPRTDEQRARQQRLRREVDDELRRLGLGEMVERADESFVGTLVLLSLDPEVPVDLVDKMQAVADLGTPSAVFIGG